MRWLIYTAALLLAVSTTSCDEQTPTEPSSAETEQPVVFDRALPIVDSYTAHRTFTVPASGSVGSYGAFCNDGDSVLGGGFYAAAGYSPGNKLDIVASNPMAGNWWQVQAANPTSTGMELQVYAVCGAIPGA